MGVEALIEVEGEEVEIEVEVVEEAGEVVGIEGGLVEGEVVVTVEVDSEVAEEVVVVVEVGEDQQKSAFSGIPMPRLALLTPKSHALKTLICLMPLVLCRACP